MIWYGYDMGGGTLLCDKPRSKLLLNSMEDGMHDIVTVR
jgi:hypothetical protein